ncbi:ABC transporter permease [Campylobacter hyointestinalis]|uniref:ABC transporter permease n=1 Tax=Campylobacter hyointestinalis subsp. lawsonii TaxID=91353 RepID=A0AAV6EGY5_CAMHY|nr:ABC transporter permease [Campylobacter hyointestinalis]KAB0613242.1 ABC transporter permease [Campylobacter hyointestinalis subsp. lawsonii]QKF69168.1 nitrate/sulfonate/bicarbonate ABC transporter, permease protein [Campylobacter hyointestinalis subsp. lawsonii]RAZ25545.1 ABC transporter permease [Campylobacter hyointestinalis subsp. lawsonii]RAZ29640.1 ABC transporter permease [Campylobacter hyointestinalis subsp. lawsonii]RAZ39652.1 ABC transporter permease [Campylobacter hyointestinalis
MRYFYQILVLVLLLILWHFSSSALIPSPAKTLEAYEQIIANNSLQIGIIDSLYRYILGLIFGVIFGVFVGFIFGFNPKFASAFDPLFNLLRPISPIAWVPIVLIIFGIGDLPTIFIIAYSVFFPMVLLSTKAIREVPSELIIVAKNFGASRWQILKSVIFPSSFLSLISSLRLAAALAWINLVVGEMLGAQTGLGYIIIDSRNQLRIDILIATIITIGVIGMIINALFGYIEKVVSRKYGYDRN